MQLCASNIDPGKNHFLDVTRVVSFFKYAVSLIKILTLVFFNLFFGAMLDFLTNLSFYNIKKICVKSNKKTRTKFFSQKKN